VDVDVEKTKKYYHSIGPEALCDCSYCKNYDAQIKGDYPAVASYLASLGVDIEKPFDVSPLEPENGMMEYCSCQYIVFGSCPDTYRHKIGEVEFCVTTSHPGTEIEEEHFVLDFSPIRLKMIVPL
jgi:hypothetical protein